MTEDTANYRRYHLRKTARHLAWALLMLLGACLSSVDVSAAAFGVLTCWNLYDAIDAACGELRGSSV